jgi:NAD-dependent SIR2 family protein deacetylase
MAFIGEVASYLYVAPFIGSRPLSLTLLKERIAELHGNSNREACNDCNKEYIRGN